MALPFGDTGFDAVFCQFSAQFFPDKEKSYREAYRVLAPRGHYVFSVWDGGYNRHARIADEIAAQFFPANPPQFYRVGTGYNKIDPIKDSLNDAGFIDLRIAVLAREKQVADIGASAHALVYGNPLIDMIRTRGGVDPDQVVNALGAALAREFGNPARLPLQAILFEATRP
jgi:SAM-dependent methyltransferase